MDLILYLKALLLGVLEGLTEFLPVSSTAHLIIAGELLNFTDERSKVFKIFIQLGAILAVCWEYRRRLIDVLTGLPRDPVAQRFAVNIIVAFLPAAVLGLLARDFIKGELFYAQTTAVMLILGGIIILFIERRPRTAHIHSVDDMTWRDALKVGCAQTLALIPGTSRSGATIMGGLLFGFSRPAITEFSFFLAVPTMFAATLYDLYKSRGFLGADDLGIFIVGFGAAFASALIAVRALLRYIAHHSFVGFAWYRIVFGLLVLAYLG